jgi:CRISPR-associated protein Cas5t
VTGAQPTLPLPPPGTIYGLIAAATGRWVSPEECRVAYVFQSEGKARDLEKVYQFSRSSNASSTVIYRDWLTNWRLWLYFIDPEWAENFHSPVFPVTLGRQQELAHVEVGPDGETVREVELSRSKTVLKGTAVPFPSWDASGLVMALPTVMSPDLPRQAIGVRPWLLVREDSKVDSPEVWHDGEYGHGVYFIGGAESEG